MAIAFFAVVVGPISLLAEFDASGAEPDLVIMAPMSDGVNLSTAVHLPNPEIFSPPYPTVLLRTPYPDILGQVPPETADMIISYLVDLFGLALVVQDTRGTGESEGDPDAFFSDWKDGPETVEWLLKQDWCDGQVMQFGLSALAIPGYLAAPEAGDNLKCQFLGEAAPDMYNLAAFHGGVFKKNTVESWLGWVGASSMLSILSDHRNCDEFWNPLILDRIPGDIHVAAMHIGGWYDVFTEGTIAGYRAYSDRGDDWARKNQYMVIGPWDHWSLAQSLGQEESFGYAMQSDMLAWVSYCLAGDDSMVSRWPHVRYYVMGSTEDGAPGNEWRSSPDWPLPTEYKSFPITAGGILADPDREMPVGDDVIGDVEADAGVDSRSLPEGGSVLPRALPFDHASTSPVVGGRNLVGSSGRMELSKVLARKDYVLFETEPLLEPFESIGRMSARLDVSTRWPDADVIVRLADVYPDGSTWIVSDGAIRLSRRNGCESAVEVQADTTYAVDVDLLTSAMVFNTGHRIALIVTSTLYAKYELNPALEAESRANGPIADAFVVHGGELLMPIASPIVDIPDSVEQAEVVEQSADALVGDLTVVADAAIDAPDSDAVEQADIAEPSTDLGADIAIDAAAGADNGDSGSGADMSNFDARDVPSIDLATRDVVDADGESHDDGGPSEEAGGCSSMGRGQQKGVPTAFLLLLLGLFGLRLRRFNR